VKGVGQETGHPLFTFCPKKEIVMSRNQALTSFSQDLYVSHSQIFTYLNCSLKYRFHYVEKRKPERISIALPFGKAMHAAEELFYNSLKAGGHKEPLKALLEAFEAVLCQSLDKNAGTPVIWKKNMPDQAGAFEMGRAMLTAFYESVDLSGYAVVDVELPLTARLYTDDGLPTEFLLVGIIDLLLMDEDSEAVVIDNKTAAQPMSQTSADENLQMSAYAYLLAANKYVFPTAPVKCRFDVLRKLKSPKFETVSTIRTAQDRKRFRENRQCCFGWYRCRHLHATAQLDVLGLCLFRGV
jgi:putative RecB family exonuclease